MAEDWRLNVLLIEWRDITSNDSLASAGGPGIGLASIESEPDRIWSLFQVLVAGILNIWPVLGAVLGVCLANVDFGTSLVEFQPGDGEYSRFSD